MATIELERYVVAFEAWARVSDQSVEVKRSIAQVAAYLRTRHRGDVEIETLCQDALGWLREHRYLVPDVGKSCLMGRMVYGGEDLRTRPCPIHGGRWSGCAIDACPAGCNYGINLTGWLPNDLVDEWPQRTKDPQLDELADALRESWSDDHATVYADRLLALGDPRGELITLELTMRVRPSDELAARYAALLETCFGDIRSSSIAELRSTRGIGERATVRLGFLEASIESASDVRKIFNSRNGRYLRKLVVRGDAAMVSDSLSTLSIRPLIWLDELTVHASPSRQTSAVAEDTAEDLIDMMPNLRSLDVTGHRVFSIYELPNVRRARLSELDSVSFVRAPQLESLELAPVSAFEPRAFALYLDELARRAPALKAIDVPRHALSGFGELSHPLLRLT
ncbi:MAG: hypothetical protein H0V17_35145 [Deltaproteobacteria bacterium]|nr:hypothetical protein [Deltaproteobacteria bacterium]